MTPTERVVLRNLPGPDGAGYGEMTICARSLRDGVGESEVMAALKGMTRVGLVERVAENRNYYRLTPDGALTRKKIDAPAQGALL